MKVSVVPVPNDRLPIPTLPANVPAKQVYMFNFGKPGGGVSQPADSHHHAERFERSARHPHGHVVLRRRADTGSDVASVESLRAGDRERRREERHPRSGRGATEVLLRRRGLGSHWRGEQIGACAPIFRRS